MPIYQKGQSNFLQSVEGVFILGNMRQKYGIPQFIIVVLAVILVACQKADPTPVVPEGDPAQAAHNFMNAFYNGDTEGCSALASKESRNQIREFCRINIERVSSIDLSEAKFEVISWSSRLEATVEMSGRWVITALTENNQLGTEIHDTSVESPVKFYMIYQDDQWRFHNFGE